MAKRIVEFLFTGSTTSYGVSGAGYVSSKTTLGELMFQETGNTPLERWAGPLPLAMARPMETAAPIPVFYPMAISISAGLDWLFLIENSVAAAAIRRVNFYTYDRTNPGLNWQGYCNITLPNATAHTVRGFRMTRDLYTTGTVSGLAGSLVLTGTGTSWTANRLAVGSRIAIGSTNPMAFPLSAWNEITAITNDTLLTLSASPGTLTAGTAYVIEELRAVIATTNATLANGGVFYAKGLRIEQFNSGGGTVPAATTVDNIRACYFLKDATTTNTIACGLAIQAKQSNLVHNLFCIDTTTTPRVYKYNLRAALTSIVGGISNNAFVLSTNAQAVTGAVSQVNNGRWGYLNHGPFSGVSGIFFATATRVYFADENNITNGNAAWISGAMVESPPGGVNTFALGGGMGSVEIANTIDRLVVMQTGAASIRNYITKFNNNTGDQFDHIFMSDDKQLDQVGASVSVTAHPSIQASAFSVWVEDGMAYLARHQTTAAQNQVYAVPLGADWTYASNEQYQNRIITPEILTPNCASFIRLYVNSASNFGNTTLGLTPEPFRVLYRTGGITNNSGAWNLLDDYSDLSGIGPATSIQFAFEFRVIGENCIPNRIYSLGVVYEDLTTDSHFQPSIGLSSLTGKRFAWRFSTAFGSTVPTLNIRLYDASAGTLLLSDNTVSASAGTWYKSLDAATWATTGLTADKTNETTYISYIPTSFADNIRVRALLTQ